METSAQHYRFRPRFGGVAVLVLISSAGLFAGVWLAGMTGTSRTLGLVGSVLGVVLTVLYLVSPAWKLTVHVRDDALEVTSAGDRRFLLPWTEVVRVVASPETRTCFVDGGDPGRSLLVPGPGASAPYDIADKAALYDAILARVPAEVVETVDLIENAAVQRKEHD